MAPDPFRYFRLEARELLDQFAAAILVLERGGDATETMAEVQKLLRLAHTLKGAARVVRQLAIADAAHAIETALAPFREAASVPCEPIEAVLRQLDAITAAVQALDAPAPEQPAAKQPAVKRPAEEPVRMVRAEIAEMDALLDGVAETHARLGGLHATQQALAAAQRLATLVAEQLAPRGAAIPPARIHPLAEDLLRSLAAIERQLADSTGQIDRELRQLRDAAEQLRLVGTGGLLTALERTARDAARSLGKTIAFEAIGSDLRLDADILAAVQDAMVQLVRNAVAHGIEAAADRRALAKPAAGRIAVEITRRGNRIVFACRDDGAGLDLAAIRRVAVERGMAAAAADRLGAEALTRLLLEGGISTAGEVSEIAGRGIGLGLVSATIERLGGTIAVASEPGQGTAIQLAVPLSLVSMEALTVTAGGIVAALPLDAVRATMLLGADAVARDAAGAMVLHEQQAIPFLWLPRLLGEGALPGERKWSVLVVAAAAGLVAVGVERLLGTARIVMRDLPEFAPASPIVAAAALDAEGVPQLVLDPDGLLEAARRQDAAAPAPEPVRHPVLVIDDSLTTRMLERSILESAGYEVDLAVSAEEGLEIARRRRYALFLVDVEMPGMDGFSFVAQAAADPALHGIPAVLVTSRNAPEDRQRGRDAGARGYTVKGEFDQAELLALIRRLVA